jgi:outer membrane protein assembly complex protein YaeT
MEERPGKGGKRLFTIDIRKGLRFDKPLVTYRGNRGLSEAQLNGALERGDLSCALFFIEPQKVRRTLKRFYESEGFLFAKVLPLKIRFEPENHKVRVQIPVREGPLFTIGELEFEGNRFFSPEELSRAGGIRRGDPFVPRKFQDAVHAIEKAYTDKGFTRARVRAEKNVNKKAGKVNLVYRIEESRQAVIEEVFIAGNSKTRTGTIRHALAFKKGDILDYRSINRSRKQLYDLGVFSGVDVKIVPLPPEGMEPLPLTGQKLSPEILPCKVQLNVTELQPYRLRYGFQFNTETAVGVSGDLSNRNVFGRGHLVGGNMVFNRDKRNLRGYYRSYSFFGKKIHTTVSPYFLYEQEPAFTTESAGISFQQLFHLDRSTIFSYTYSLEREHTFDPDSPSPTDTNERVARLTTSFTRDTRDAFLDATRGMFLIQSLEYAPKLLGSQSRYIRYYGQYFYYRKFLGPLVYASGVRAGFGKGIGQDLPDSAKFFAGGSTTVRGFEKDEVGPRDPVTGKPAGGDSVFILNQELRFPVYKLLRGVVFADLGNVYPTVSDFDPFDVRSSAGFGLRVKTPYVLVRFDWGFKLDRRTGESPSEFFFSIGQAF